MQRIKQNIIFKVALTLFSAITLVALAIFTCSCSCSSTGEMPGWDFDISKLKLANMTSQVIIVAPDKEDSNYADLLFAQKNKSNVNTTESEDEKIVTKEEAELGKAFKSREDGTDANSVKKQSEQEADSSQANSDDTTSESALYDANNNEYSWDVVIKCKVRIGKSGIGNNAVDDNKTPKGVFGITEAFGTEENPGTLLNYVKTDDSYFWVRDVKSASYNKLVSINNVRKDWGEALNISNEDEKYDFSLVLDYNISNNDKNKASGIFFECGGNEPTNGSISLPKDQLKKLLLFIDPICKVIIDTKENIYNY